MSDALVWVPTHGCASFGWSATTYLHQLCVETSLEDLLREMDDMSYGVRESGKTVLSGWLESVYIYIYIYIYSCVSIHTSVCVYIFYIDMFF